MKKLLAFCIMAIFFVACGSSSSPKAVAEKFLTATQKGDFEEAKKYGDSQTADLLNLVTTFGGESLKEEIKKEGVKEFTIEKVEEKDDLATVTYKVEGKENFLRLKKIDGEWKVSMNKENMNKENALPEGKLNESTIQHEGTNGVEEQEQMVEEMPVAE